MDEARAVFRAVSQDAGNGAEYQTAYKPENQPAYGMRDYNRLTRLLEYKLPDRGLLSPVMVSSVDIFAACHSCGHNSKSNRSMKNLFICTACGATMEIEKLGRLNLARKLINYSSSKIKIKVARTQDGVIFNNDIRGLNCFSSNQADHLEMLKWELGEIIKNTSVAVGSNAAKRRTRTAKMSMVMKLTGTEDFMDMLEYF